MLFEIETQKPMAELEKALQEAIARHGFGVLATHDVKETLQKKGVEFGRQCLIYEVCNPLAAKKVLEANPAVSTALPCRISLYATPSGSRLATILPTALLGMFNTPELDEVAQQVEAALRRILQEAAS